MGVDEYSSEVCMFMQLTLVRAVYIIYIIQYDISSVCVHVSQYRSHVVR